MEIKLILIFIIFVVIAETFSQYYIKKSAVNNNFKYLFFALLFYCIVIYFLYKIYLFHNMGPTFLIWSVLSTMSIYFIGHIIYKEKITIQDVIGGSLCFIGLYLVYKK
jgi:multidrug transporter EmrE-like cation transporter